MPYFLFSGCPKRVVLGPIAFGRRHIKKTIFKKIEKNKQRNTFRRDLEDKTSDSVPLSSLHTAFGPWEGNIHIQVGKNLFVSPAEAFQ
jgi:hypothetical protein